MDAHQAVGISVPNTEEEMENDLSGLEIVEAGRSELQDVPGNESKQDASFITPTKRVDFVLPDETPRRSPRVPKPKYFPDDDTSDFRTSFGEISPGTAPSSPNARTPKFKTTSTPRTFNPGSEGGTPASPNLEAIGSNDSFVVPTSICRVLQVSPRKTPNKAGASGSACGGTLSKNTPTKDSDTLNKSGPSPYKSNRPKYLPKNIKLVKKKRLERDEFRQKVEQFEAQLVKLPTVICSSKRVVNPAAASDGDLLGTQPYLAVIFHPDNFFVSFDEHSFDTNSDMSIDELVRFVTYTPYLMTAKDLRTLSLFLSVTSDKHFFDKASLVVEENLNRVKYVLAWEDLKMILINFGLVRDFYEFDSAGYCALDPPKVPRMRNFQFLFWLVEKSFPTWSKNRLMRLIKFLSDCLFDPILQRCQHDVVMIFRRVTKHVIALGSTVNDLLVLLNHSHYSMSCNRVIIQFLAPDLLLQPLARSLAYRTICGLLKLDVCEDNFGSSLFCRIVDLLSDTNRVRESTTIQDIYQLVCICEVLAAMAPRPFDDETKTYLEKLADFAEHVSLTYTSFENLYFTDTVTRLRTLSTINSF